MYITNGVQYTADVFITAPEKNGYINFVDSPAARWRLIHFQLKVELDLGWYCN